MIGGLLAALALLLDAPTAAAGSRIIVHVNPQEVLHCTIVEHAEDGLRIRTTDGQERFIDPATVQRVLHLVDCDPPVSAQVQLRSGRIIHGMLLADDWTIVRMLVHGEAMTIPRDDVSVLQVDRDVEALYRRERALADDNDEARRIELACWLMANRAWSLAADELQAIDERFDSAEARRLGLRAETFAALASKPVSDTHAAAGAPPPLEGDGAPPATPPQARPTPQSPLTLPGEDIVNLIRVLELDPVDGPPVSIGEATRKRLHLGWGGNRLLPAGDAALRTLLGMAHGEVLQLMFDLRARPLYGEIEVLEPPESLQLFARDVHDKWLVTRCGTRSCHGGANAGRFRLLQLGRVDDRVRTANLLLLEQTLVDEGPLLNWTTPADSLLVQYALPRHRANAPHPPVPGWRPALDDDRLESVLRWIRSMRQPRPAVAWPPAPPVDPAPIGAQPSQALSPSDC